ncbi:MAG: hypothetical protein ABI887_10970 [Burkholderiales bacterium]
MNAAAPWMRVLLAPWQQRRNQGAMWPWLLILGVVGVPALACLATPTSNLVRAVALNVLAMPLAGGWIWVLLNLMKQNHPTAARLVPGQLRTLRCVLFGAWLGFTGLGVLLGAAVGHPWAAAAGTALLLTLLMWLVRVPILGVFFWLVPASATHWAHTPVAESALRSLYAAWQGQPDRIVLTGAVTLLAAAGLTPFVLRAGGSRHAQAYRRRVWQFASMPAGAAGRTSWHGSVLSAWLGHGTSGLYRRWLATVGTQRSGPMLPRALLGLGPAIHWTGQLGQLLTFGGAAALVMFALWQANVDTSSIPVAAWGLSAGVLTFAVNVALQARAAIHGTRREQALMMLLPGMPRGRALNRGLARRLSAQFITSWALGVLACVAVLPLGDHLAWFAIYAAACLPLGALLWTDWSTLKPPTATSAVAPLMVVMPLALGAMAAQAWMDVPAWTCVLVFVVAAVWLVVWRAWRLADAPSAFPAGRLG